MAFSLADYRARWPYAYHLTAGSNVPYLKATGTLYSATQLCLRFKVDPQECLAGRRATRRVVSKNGVSVEIRDQAPLHEGNIRFEDGWDFQHLMDALNGRCFFWSGTAVGPNPYGLRHFARYEAEHPVVLRVPASGLPGELEFCRFNWVWLFWNHGREEDQSHASAVT